MSIIKTLNSNPTEAEELFDKTMETIENRKISQEEIRKGRVVKWHNTYGFISDGEQEYFVHYSDVISPHLRKGNLVRFTATVDEDGKLRAVNVKKTGHGKHHPFLNDLRSLEETIKNADIDEEEKRYRLRDIQMFKNYFTEIEDAEIFNNVRDEFRPKN